MSKFILPWFGGSPGVWTTCMLFFQVVLFLGYAYAHGLTRLPRRWQGIIHGVLALAALACLPISPSDAWKPTGNEDPTQAILLLLAATVGLPYFVLSSTSPLVQVWFSRAIPGGQPWRLYALSNIGSLAALLSYPFFFEPRWDVGQQTKMWSVAFIAFVSLSLYGALRDRSSIPAVSERTEAADEVADQAVPWWHRVLWVFLPAMASIMLLATTNEVCQDVAVIPFMWVAPLSLYLLTFIICFEHERWYKPALWAVPAMALLFLAAGWSELSEGWNELVPKEGWGSALQTNFVHELAAYFLAMFAACMVCHGELTRLKPPHRHLTEFYLMMSAGGAVGGLTVSLIAPKAFTTYTEWPMGLIACFIIALVVVVRELRRSKHNEVRAVVSIVLLLAPVFVFLSKADKATPSATTSIWARSYEAWKPFTRLSWEQMPAWAINTFYVLLAVSIIAVIVLCFRRRHWLQISAAGALLITFIIALFHMEVWGFTIEPRIDRVRNFYGAISVSEEYDPGLEVNYRKLSHGTITHGIQNLGRWKEIPITYYGHSTGVGMALDTLKDNPTARVGVVGMGAGTVACYAKPGQTYRFYDINPDIVRLAQKDFTYLDDMEKRGAKLEIVIGDARLSLEREIPQQFDVILLDAFSGDSVPVHLLTKQAFEIYKHHLKPNGIIAVHVTNTYLRLAPVVNKVAAAIGMKTTRVETDAEGDDYSTDYILVTNNDAFLTAHPVPHSDEQELDVPVW
ncbi:MAG: integral rane protein-like protein, partial [Verrucomicrobiaceae bacterium]|nr:integral rane protein-like protein [Verrucomicrobiaceae bacterium]